MDHAPASDLHPNAFLGHDLTDDGSHKPGHGCPRIDNFLTLAERKASKQRVTAASNRSSAHLANHANLCL